MMSLVVIAIYKCRKGLLTQLTLRVSDSTLPVYVNPTYFGLISYFKLG